MKNILIFIFGISLFSDAFPQEHNPLKFPDVIPPSPTASSLGIYADYPVDYYTGVPNISIPLYEVKSGDIEFPISISYHASGIRVSDEASWVGLGWALNAGGVITRSIRGKDDFANNGYLEESEMPSTGNLPYYENETDFNNKKLIYDRINSGEVDGEPDIFFYNFSGKSGKMLLERSSANIINGVTIDVSNLQFQYNISNKTWTVIDEFGWRYYFGTTETSWNYSSSGSETIRYTRLDTISGALDVTGFISAWYIDKIVSPSGNEVDFLYDTQARRTIGQINYHQGQYQNYNELYRLDKAGANWYGTKANQNYSYTSANMSLVSNVYLKQINFRNGYVQFITSDRLDMRQDYLGSSTNLSKPQKLDYVKIYQSNNAILKQIYFNNSYYNQNIIGYNKENYWRLKLNSIEEQFYNNSTASFDKKPPYIFTYNSIDLPAKNSAAIDHWGYYNGKENDQIFNSSNKTISSWNNIENGVPFVIENDNSGNGTYKTFLPRPVFTDYRELIPNGSPFSKGANREPDVTYMKSSILEEVKFPTGGATRFTFEPNEFYSDDDELDYYCESFKDEYLEVIASDIEVREFSVDEDTELKLICELDYSGSEIDQVLLDNINVGIQNANNEDIIVIQPSLPLPNGDYFYANVYVLVPAGTYKLIADNGGYGSLDISLKVQYVDRTYDYQTPGELIKTGGGLRIARIENLDYGGAITKSKEFTYGGTISNPAGTPMTPIEHIFPLNASCANMVYTVSPEVFNNSIVRSSGNRVPLGSSAQGNFVGYGEVTVTDLGNDNIGSIRYSYRNIREEKPDCFVAGVPNVVNLSNGNLLKEEYFNANNIKVKEKSFVYLDNEKESILITKGIKTILGIYRNTGAPNYTATSYCIRFYDVYCEWWRPREIVETIYDINGSNGLTNSYKFVYNNDHLLAQKEHENSSGDIFLTNYKYPLDYTPDVMPEEPVEYHDESIMYTMWRRNMIGMPIETVSKKNGKIIGGTIIKYDVFPYVDNYVDITENHLILPTAGYQIETTTPIGEANFTNSKVIYQPSFTMDGSYIQKMSFDEYDNNGNILQYHEVNGGNMSYFWGYNNTIPIIEAKNISYANLETAVDIALSEMPTRDYIGIVDLETFLGEIKKVDSPEEIELLGHFYYKLKSELDDVVSGMYSFKIYTYDPLIGTTSVTDENGITTFYRYDSFGRLEEVLDNDGNIINSHEYKYVQ